MMAILVGYGRGRRSAASMPKPDCVIGGENGDCWPAMFHYAREGDSMDDIARDHGFDLKTVHMNDDLPHDSPLAERYENGADSKTVLEAWMPSQKHRAGGWELCGMWDTEDGPVAIYLRKRATAQPAKGEER